MQLTACPNGVGILRTNGRRALDIVRRGAYNTPYHGNASLLGRVCDDGGATVCGIPINGAVLTRATGCFMPKSCLNPANNPQNAVKTDKS